jgi:iron complex outermembrane receptor protein
MKITITALILGFSGIISAQNKISGTVTDEKNQPMAAVSVYAPEIHKSTMTNAEGKYELASVPTGELKIIFSYIGYTSQEKTSRVSSGKNILDIMLAESIHQMDEVIVSTAFNRLQSQNVMKVEHATLKSLQQKGVSTLIEGLATIPGVAQVSTGISIGKPVIRGLSSNRVLVYSQGVRLENQQFGDEHGLGLNDSGIESVEVIKGPASLLYGSDALGGVLYFNPEKFADANTFKGDFSQKLFSNTLGSNSSLGFKGSTENWKFLLRGDYATHSDYMVPDGDRVTNTRYNEIDIKGGVGYSNSKVSSVFRYNLNHVDLGIFEGDIGEQTQNKSPDFPRQEVYNQIFSLHNNFFFTHSKLDADIGYIANDRSELEDSVTAGLRMKLNTLNYDIKYHFAKTDKFETIAGIQGMTQTNENFGEELLIPDATTNDFGIFTTTIYSWRANMIQAGIRYDYREISTAEHGNIGEENYFGAIDKSFDSFNASLGYKTDVAENTILRLNAASGFRAPNLAELTSNGVHEGTNRYEIGNSDLTTEQNFQADLNLEYKTEHFEFFLNGFYNHINNYIYASPTGDLIDGNFVYKYVQSDAQLFGGEAGIHIHPHPIDWLHLESAFDTVTGKNANGNYLPLIPANNWSNTIRAEFNIKNWLSEGYARLNISTTFAQNDVSGFETETNRYSLVNCGFGGKIKIDKAVFEMTLNGNNLFDKTYIAHVSRLKTDGIPNIGRNIVLGLNFNI